MSPREIAAKISKLYSDAEIKTLCRYKDKYVAFLVDPNDRDGHYDDNYVVFTEDGKQIAYSLFNDFEMLGGLEQVPFGEWHGGAMTQSGVRAADANSLEHYNRGGAADSLEHYNRKGSHWYEHKYGKWQKQAKYAGGMDDPKGYDAGPLLDEAERFDPHQKRGVFDRSNAIYENVDLRTINPKKATGRPEYITNCAYCTMAFELNMRGYKVQAAPCVWFKTEDIGKYFKGAEKSQNIYFNEDSRMNIVACMRDILREPIGARGYLSIQTDYGGHAVAWTHANKNDLTLVDAQSGKQMRFRDLTKLAEKTWVGFGRWRLDNCEINEKNIDDVIDTKEGKTTWQDLSDEVEDARKKVKHSDNSHYIVSAENLKTYN